MIKDMGSAGACVIGVTPRTLILPNSYLNHIEHEYAHSQSEGLYTGYCKLLFSGLNEAVTEDATSEPGSYYE